MSIARPLRLSFLFLLLVSSPPLAAPYSLLTHEQLIDLTWQDSIVPLLLSRYPNLTPAELRSARAYAYGGCVIQDIGYYPYGDRFFSDLTHYVRSGDFVVNLFRNAHNADELAFAVGALSHYVGDSVGHSEATNLAVAIEFPKLGARYGPVVSYAEGKHQHVRAEFAFDIDEIAHHRIAPLTYKRQIGLKVPVHQLSKAFYQTYGLVDFGDHNRHRFNVREYRFAVHTLIPRIAYAVTLLHRRGEPAEPPTADAAEVEKEAAATAALDHWGIYRRHAGFETYALAALILVLPKFGPLSIVAVKGPTPSTDADYMHSVVRASSALREILARFAPPHVHPKAPARPDPHAQPSAPLPVPGPGDDRELFRATEDPRHPLPNRDLDTGYVVKPGGYSLTDSTFAALLHHLTRQPAQPIPPGVKIAIQAYYANPDAPISTKNDQSRWEQVQADLQTLAAMPTSSEPEPFPTYTNPAE
jgi:hypothetical protein